MKTENTPTQRALDTYTNPQEWIAAGCPEKKHMTPQEKAAATKRRKKQEAYEAAEADAKAEIKRLGYGPRFYAGKCHAIKGLGDHDTYYQEQFPGGYDSWQETLEAIREKP